MRTTTIGRVDEGYEEAVPTARLERWSGSFSDTTGTGVLYGDVYDDVRKRFADGTAIHTSLITDISGQCFEEGSIIKTTYSTYLLGKKRSHE